jgi:hypothetical protein
MSAIAESPSGNPVLVLENVLDTAQSQQCLWNLLPRGFLRKIDPGSVASIPKGIGGLRTVLLFPVEGPSDLDRLLWAYEKRELVPIGPLGLLKGRRRYVRETRYLRIRTLWQGSDDSWHTLTIFGDKKEVRLGPIEMVMGAGYCAGVPGILR